MLVSRTQSKLDEVASDLHAKYGIEVTTCSVDLCKAEQTSFDKIAACVEGLDLGILINNAGMSYDHPDFLDTLEPSFITDMANINMVAPTKVSRVGLVFALWSWASPLVSSSRWGGLDSQASTL